MSKRTIIKQVRHPMDWVQIITIIGSMVGVWYAFYNITDKRIDKMEERLEKMDAKWERLFERLLLQDQKSKGSVATQ